MTVIIQAERPRPSHVILHRQSSTAHRNKNCKSIFNGNCPKAGHAPVCSTYIEGIGRTSRRESCPACTPACLDDTYDALARSPQPIRSTHTLCFSLFRHVIGVNDTFAQEGTGGRTRIALCDCSCQGAREGECTPAIPLYLFTAVPPCDQ